MQRRLAVAPDALLERPAQLGLVGLAHQIARLVVEGGVQEEALVGEPERLAGLADSALAEGYELLAFRQSADGDGPFFESNWHKRTKEMKGHVWVQTPRTTRNGRRPDVKRIRNPGQNPKSPANRHFIWPLGENRVVKSLLKHAQSWAPEPRSRRPVGLYGSAPETCPNPPPPGVSMRSRWPARSVPVTLPGRGRPSSRSRPRRPARHPGPRGVGDGAARRSARRSSPETPRSHARRRRRRGEAPRLRSRGAGHIRRRAAGIRARAPRRAVFSVLLIAT